MLGTVFGWFTQILSFLNVFLLSFKFVGGSTPSIGCVFGPFFGPLAHASNGSGPVLRGVTYGAKPILRGPNSTEPNMFHHGETPYRVR